MSTSPKVSVIIPIYNASEYLDQCLESVMKQTLEEIEIICIDDGSTDSSLDIITDLQKNDKRINIFQIQNSGAGVARNVGLEHANGEYIFFCDSDDTLYLNSLLDLYSVAIDSTADVVVGGFSETFDDGRTREVSVMNYASNEELLFKHIMVWHKLFRNKFLKDYNIKFPASTQGEDRAFMAFVYIHDPIVRACSACVYNWIRHEQSNTATLTRQYNYRSFRDRIGNWILFWQLTAEKSGEQGKKLLMDSLGYLRDQCKFISIETERAQAFCLLQLFVQQIDWSDASSVRSFRGTFSCTPEEFVHHSYESYFATERKETKGTVDYKLIVERQFLTGAIGLRYIIRYFKAWLKYKLKLGGF